MTTPSQTLDQEKYSQDSPLVEAKDISKSFEGKRILSGFSLSIVRGERFALVGPSGCGKSVFLKMLLGFIEGEGVISFSGHALKTESFTEREERFRSMGILFQGSALFDSLPVWKNIAFPLFHSLRSALPMTQAQERAREMLRYVDLPEDIMNLIPSELSGGMQRRVALARAMIHNPTFLVCDEPTAGLDPISSHLIGKLLDQYCEKHQSTLLIVSHDLALIRQLSQRIGLVDQGKLAWSGKSKEAFSLQTPVVRRFFNP